MPKVSVIIPTYNSHRTLQESIKSVLAQDFQDLELIVVNDGSKDSTESVVREIQSKSPIGNIVYLSFGKNQGEASASNYGIQNANGELIALLDHDDTLPTNSLGDRVRFLDQNPKVLAVYGNADLFNERGFYTTKVPPNLPNEEIAMELFRGKSVPVWIKTVMYRKSAFEEIGYFDPKLKRALDLDIGYRLLMTGHVGYVNCNVYNHKNSHNLKKRIKHRVMATYELFLIANKYARGTERLCLYRDNLLIQSRKMVREFTF